MNGQELYEEGKQLLARALENTPFTHIHSEDIRLDVLNQYYIPSAKFGYVPAKMDIYYKQEKQRLNELADRHRSSFATCDISQKALL